MGTTPDLGCLEIRKEVIPRFGGIYNAEGIMRTVHRENDMTGPAKSRQSCRADHFVVQLGRPLRKGRPWPRNYRFAGC